MRNEHLIVDCAKCDVVYDMDFEEAIDDDHVDSQGNPCYSEDWNVTCVPCDEWEECNCAPPKEGPSIDWTSLVAEKPL